MIDSHSHLYFNKFDKDRAEVIQRSKEAGVTGMIMIGIDLETSVASMNLAAQDPNFYATVGLHPASHVPDPEKELQDVCQLARDKKEHFVAIGEIGLDYYWKDVTKEIQRERLHTQLDLADELELPVIYHVRDALHDHLALLEERDTNPQGVFHCFGGGPDEAKRALALGYHVSFAGNVTYPKATELQEAAKVVPPERLLLETDAPFMSPQPKRGKRNEPAFMVHTRDYLADLHGIDREEFGELCERTTRELFGLV